MRILLAMNSFKGCLRAFQAAAYLQRGIGAAHPAARITILPVSDGGEGTLDLFLHRLAGTRIEVPAIDPLGRPVSAAMGLFREKGYVLIESAHTCGLELLKEREQNPWYASTAGLGMMIHQALDTDAATIVITLGGSATNDGGLGMARVLGHEGLDKLNRPVPAGGLGLCALRRLSPAGEPHRLREKEFIICADVDHPLTGPQGATHTFGKQKGAGVTMRHRMEIGMLQLEALFRKHYPHYIPQQAGGGAAGGLGAALQACTRGRLINGFQWIARETGLWDEIQHTDLLITGEGSMDRQSLKGKATVQLAREAASRGIKALAVNGHTEPAAANDLKEVFDGMYTLDALAAPGEDPMLHAGKLLQKAGKRIGQALGKPQ